MYSLNDYIIKWQKEKNYSWNSFWLMFGSFLDSFYLTKDKKKFKKEPQYNDDVPKEIKSFVAAAVDYLCDGKNTLKWVKNKKYNLEEPFFLSNVKGLIKVVMLIESPIEFKSRNIYVTSDVLSRV